MNPIEIRKATVSDVEAIQKLSIQTFKETFSAVNTPENLANYIKDSFSLEQLTAELNNDLYKKVEIIDELLFEIINPNGLSFNEETLIKEYGFPKDDLDAIDMDSY